MVSTTNSRKMSSNKKIHTEQGEEMHESDEDFSDEEDSEEEEGISAGNEVKTCTCIIKTTKMFNKKLFLKEIQIDFEGRNPIAGDFDGIKQLLRQLFLKAHVNLTEFANLIVSQNYVGSVIKQSWDEEMDDEDDGEEDPNVVFGITTVLNLTEHKETECVQQIKSLILERAEKSSTDATLKMLRDILTNDARTTGLLLNERYINIPSQISVPMLENLCKEIKRASEKDLPYNFSYLVMILKFHRGKSPDDVYSNPEEELFFQESLASFEYSVKSESDTGLSGKWRENDEELTPFRKVVVLDAKKLPSIVESINGFIHGS